MKFINLTPHPVVLSNGALKITFAKDYNIPTARVEQLIVEKTIECEVVPGMIINMPMNAVTRSTVYGLPEPEEGVMYICSSMVATHVKRPDVISPITDTTCERDASGRVISVKGFQTFSAITNTITNLIEELPKVEPELTVAASPVLNAPSVAYRNGRLVVTSEA